MRPMPFTPAVNHRLCYILNLFSGMLWRSSSIRDYGTDRALLSPPCAFFDLRPPSKRDRYDINKRRPFRGERAVFMDEKNRKKIDMLVLYDDYKGD
jgi:hypothetical protein